MSDITETRNRVLRYYGIAPETHPEPPSNPDPSYREPAADPLAENAKRHQEIVDAIRAHETVNPPSPGLEPGMTNPLGKP